MTTFDLEEREAIADFGRAWWVFLVTGILWFLVSIIILRFDYTIRQRHLDPVRDRGDLRRE